KVTLLENRHATLTFPLAGGLSGLAPLGPAASRFAECGSPKQLANETGSAAATPRAADSRSKPLRERLLLGILSCAVRPYPFLATPPSGVILCRVTIYSTRLAKFGGALSAYASEESRTSGSVNR